MLVICHTIYLVCVTIVYIHVMNRWGFAGGSVVKSPPTMQEMQIQTLGGEDSLEKEMATPSSIPAWEIPWTGEPGRLESTGLQKS